MGTCWFFYIEVANKFTNSSRIVFVLLFCIEFIPWLFLSFSIFFFKKYFSFDKKLILPFFAGLFAGPIAMYCYINAISIIGLSLSSSITSLYPVIATLLAFIFLKEKLNLLGFFGIFLAFGALFFLYFDQFNLNFIGFILAFLCALSWGVELILSSVALKSLPTISVYYARQTGASFGYAILILTQNLIFVSLESISFDFFILLFFLIFAWSISYFLYYFAIANIGIIKAMMLNISYIIWITLIQKEFNLKQIILVVLIFIGINLVLWSKKEKN